MKYKILKFLGFERCDFCGKYLWKYKMKQIRTSESPKDRCGYKVHACKKCWDRVRKDND